MAIEPKKLLQENIPLVACYVAALVAVIVYVVVVMPMSSTTLKKKQSSLKRVTKKLQDLDKLVEDKKLLTTKDKEAFVKVRQNLENQIGQLAQIYIDEDKKLEVWFPELGVKEMSDSDSGHPQAGKFKELYKSKFDKLVARHKKILQPEGAEKPVLVYEDPKNSAKAQILAQKQFWFKEDLLEVFKENGVQEVLTDIRGIPPSSGLASDGENEKPYSEFEFTMSVKLPFTLLPKLVRSILAAKFTYKLKSLSIRRPEFSYKVDDPGKMQINDIAKAKHFGSPTYTITFPESVSEFTEDEATLIPEPGIIADITVRALDFSVKPVKK